MKVRIKGNSIRIRVTRSELQRILTGEKLHDAIRFGIQPEASFGYALSVAEIDAPVAVEYSDQTVSLRVARQVASAWGHESEVGIYATIPVSAGLYLDVMIEKDFACLDRSDAENADTFANPKAGAIC